MNPIPTVSVAIRDYLLACEIENKAPTTLRWYSYMLRLLGTRYPSLPVDAMTAALMRQVLAELKRTGKADETYSNHVRVMKQFWNWAATEYHLESPMRNIRVPPFPRKIPEVIPIGAVKQLIAATDNSDAGLRDRAIIYLLADTGVRASGLLGLKIADLNLDERYCIVREKGKHARVVPLSTRTVGHLRRWLVVRPKGKPAVFCSLRPRDLGNQMTDSGLRLLLLRLARKAKLGADVPVHPHAFRHFAALAMRQRGADVGIVAQIVGHTDVHTTVHIYGQYSAEALVEMHQRFSPINLLEAL